MDSILSSLLTILLVIALVAVALCLGKTAELFNILDKGNSRYKTVLAWDLLILFFAGIALIIKIVNI